MIQRQHSVLLQLRHSKPLSWYNVNIMYYFRYATVNRCRDTTSTRCISSATSQLKGVVIQRQIAVLLLLRHSKPFSWYNVNSVSLPLRHIKPLSWYNVNTLYYFRYVTVNRCRDTTSTRCSTSATSQWNGVVIQRQHAVLLPLRPSKPLSWYNVNTLYYFRYVTVKRCRDTTSTCCIFSATSQ